jgi:hypothetical protein
MGKEFSEHRKPENRKPRNIIFESARGTLENVVRLKALDKWIVYS